jgi:hypothetical protein
VVQGHARVWRVVSACGSPRPTHPGASLLAAGSKRKTVWRGEAARAKRSGCLLVEVTDLVVTVGVGMRACVRIVQHRGSGSGSSRTKQVARGAEAHQPCSCACRASPVVE